MSKKEDVEEDEEESQVPAWDTQGQVLRMP